MPTIEVPRRPTILNFTPLATKVFGDGSAYIDNGTHLDTEWKVRRITPPADIYSQVIGFGTTQVGAGVIISLVPGVAYSLRMRYKNESGFGQWSKRFAASVPTDLDFASLAIPAEPTATQVIPVDPDFAVNLVRNRPIIEARLATGHLRRRLAGTDERRSVRMVWENISGAQKNTLRTFLNARIAATPPEGFLTTDLVHGARGWFVRDAAVETVLVEGGGAGGSGAGVWNLTVDCLELFTDQAWTVGVSAVGGPDPIS